MTNTNFLSDERVTLYAPSKDIDILDPSDYGCWRRRQHRGIQSGLL